MTFGFGFSVPTPNTLYSLNVAQSVPIDLLQEHVKGIKFRNVTPWDILLQGYGSRQYPLPPYGEVYIPNTMRLAITAFTQLLVQSEQDRPVNLRELTFKTPFLGLEFYVANDVEPTNAYQTVLRPSMVSIGGPVDLEPALLTATSGIVAGATGSTTTLSASITAEQGGLWLTAWDITFGVPVAAATINVSLQDGNGGVIENYHFNAGILPMPGIFYKYLFNHPLRNQNTPSAGVGTFKIVVPTVANAPGYAVNMEGYAY